MKYLFIILIDPIEMVVKLTLVFLYIFTSHVILALDHKRLDDCIKKTGVQITPQMLKTVIHGANHGGTFDMDLIPEDMLCLTKCVLEKKNIINSNGKISIGAIENDALTLRIPNKKKFLDCLRKIDKIDKCDDMKKMLECRISSQ